MAAYTNTTIIADTADAAGFLGKNVDAGFTATMQDLVGVYIEGYLCNLVEYDIVTNWATINAIYKLIFSEFAVRTIAIAGIQYETAAYSNGLEETENMVAIHTNRLNEIHKLLKEASVQDFLGV